MLIRSPYLPLINSPLFFSQRARQRILQSDWFCAVRMRFSRQAAFLSKDVGH